MKKILILFAILAMPSIAYLLMRTGKNKYTTLEIYGPKEPITKTVNGKIVVDTIYHSIGSFSLLNSDSTIVTEKLIEGKIFVADFFFTNCSSICPKMSGQLMRVQYEYKEDSSVVILSHTVDPEHDTPSVLKQYAKKYEAIPSKWVFLTGNKKTIYDLARNNYFISATGGDGGKEDFIHSEQMVLVDKKKHIRGYYDGTDVRDVRRLMDEIKLLEIEDEQSK